MRYALSEVIGAFAIAVMEEGKPEEIVVARLGSPLVIGIGADEFFYSFRRYPFY